MGINQPPGSLAPARQARDADRPVLLAIRGVLGTHVEQYEIALYGRTVARAAPGGGTYVDRFDATGILATPCVDQPTIAGVLAMPEIGVAGSSEPVLYTHRRFTGALPAALQALERRVMGDKGVTSVPATASALDRVPMGEGVGVGTTSGSPLTSAYAVT